MATPSKAQFLTEVQTLLKKRYKPKGDKEKDHVRLTVLESVVYAIAHEGATRFLAQEALDRFKSNFFDWNEVRVSTIEEVRTTLGATTDSEPRAQKIRRFLRQLFEKTYGFTLEALAKKPLKESMKVLSEYEAIESDFVMATVIQQSLGGHAIPIDGDSRRALERLGVVESDLDISAVRSLIERAVPKNRGFEFLNLLEDLAHDTCVANDPHCSDCELRKICPTPLAKKDEPPQAAKTVKGNPGSEKPAKAKPSKTAEAKTSTDSPPPEPEVTSSESASEQTPSKKAPAKPPKATKSKPDPHS